MAVVAAAIACKQSVRLTEGHPVTVITMEAVVAYLRQFSVFDERATQLFVDVLRLAILI